MRPSVIIACIVCGLAFAFDLAEVALSAVFSTLYAGPGSNTSASQLAWLLAAPYIGGVIGAPLSGVLADRYGRRQVLTALLCVLAATSVAGGISQDILGLTLARGFSGLALGAFPPIMFAYLTDLLPAKHRAQITLSLVALASLGAPLCVFLVRGLTPHQPLGMEAWRLAIFVCGGAAVVLALALRLFAPDTRGGPAVEAADAHVLMPKARHEVGFGVMSFMSAWATVAFPMLTGALLISKGIKMPDAMLYVAISLLGPTVGSLVTSTVVGRLPRKTVLQSCLVAMLVAGAAFGLLSTPTALVVAGLTFNIAGVIYLSASNLYFAEIHPQRARGTAVSLIWALNRLGAVVAPLVLVPLLASNGPVAALVAIAIAVGVSWSLWLFSPRPVTALGDAL